MNPTYNLFVKANPLSKFKAGFHRHGLSLHGRTLNQGFQILKMKLKTGDTSLFRITQMEYAVI